MNPIFTVLGVVSALFLTILINASLYTVDQREQAIVTQFGKPVGEPISTPGLHVKTPFIQTINTLPRIVLEWDGPAAEMRTRDKKNIVVDNFARWRIKEPLTFFKQLRDIRTAESRLNDILGSETRVVVAKHDFIEMVRSDKTRKVDPASLTSTSVADARLGTLPEITTGRQKLEQEILSNAQIAERFRSEGAGEAAKIEGNRERELKEIESEAYKKVQEIEGAADAKALEIYAKAYKQSPESVQLFEFTKALDTLKKSLTPDTTLILTTEGDLLRYLKGGNTTPEKAGPIATAPAAPVPTAPLTAPAQPGL